MQTYWENTELEKMKMTREEVQAYLDVELMTKGVVKVTTPNFQEIKDITHFEKVTYYSCAGVLFKTIEQANSFLQLNPMKEGYDYYGAGYDYKYAEPVEPLISQIPLFKKSDVIDNCIIFKSNKTAKEFNEAEKKRHEKELAIMDETLSPVWDDWNQKQSLKYKCEKINRTYLEYLEMTKGDKALAKDFLSKLYPISEIELSQAFITQEKGEE